MVVDCDTPVMATTLVHILYVCIVCNIIIMHIIYNLSSVCSTYVSFYTNVHLSLSELLKEQGLHSSSGSSGEHKE